MYDVIDDSINFPDAENLKQHSHSYVCFTYTHRTQAKMNLKCMHGLGAVAGAALLSTYITRQAVKDVPSRDKALGYFTGGMVGLCFIAVLSPLLPRH